MTDWEVGKEKIAGKNFPVRELFFYREINDAPIRAGGEEIIPSPRGGQSIQSNRKEGRAPINSRLG